MSLGEEDLGVLMKILVENIREGSKEHSMDVNRQVAHIPREEAEQLAATLKHIEKIEVTHFIFSRRKAGSIADGVTLFVVVLHLIQH